MIGGQKQTVGDNGTAIQASGPVTVNHGITIKQMSEIMLELQRLVGEFTAQAASTAEARIAKFQKEILERFEDEKRANREAFKDPDFQFLLGSAQLHSARDGNEQSSNLLVELLAARSLQPERNRIALILNQATETISKITDEDIAILTVAFLLFRTTWTTNSYENLIINLKNTLSPSLPLIRNSSACEYLESIGCLSINGLMKRDLIETLINDYSIIFSNTFSIEEIDSISDNSTIKEALINEIDNNNNNIKFKINNKDAILKRVREIGFSEEEIKRLEKLLQVKQWDKDAVLSKLQQDIPNFAYLSTIWPESHLQSITLTSVGIAIAHANLSRLSNFNASLSIWVK